MQLNGGWLVEARRVPSPHQDSRPDNETPSLLVVHNIFYKVRDANHIVLIDSFGNEPQKEDKNNYIQKVKV